ncbi:MAG: molecular chaperone HtpG [Erysipelotrichaceae bacterium]|nr:molecular chaperone HtpG [Erysipelotrichaceae bacterium]
MAVKQFKTESKRLLDLMANSIYTNTDIFLRELISNASDALDKRHYLSLTDESIPDEKPYIRIGIDKKNRIITIADNGIGMNKEELENNLGTIAKSGSSDFKEALEKGEEVDIIGQFGVGFYSAFMVAKKIEVLTRKPNEEKAYSWVSESEEGYEIKTASKEEAGTLITLTLKDNTKEKKYDKYLDKDEVRSLIKRYSDYIRYPILMNVDVVKPSDKEGHTETVEEEQTVNSMIPLWKKTKKDIKDEDYDNFYQSRYYDYVKPLKTIHYKVEGNTSYTALLFIPGSRPYNYFTNDYKAGLSLYSRGVFIKDEAKELISDHFRFVRGIVDSDDLNLNISREILQQDHQMAALRKSIDKKVRSTLVNMLEKEREDYEKFFDQFGVQLKYGAYDNFGEHKDELIDLLLFKSTYEDKYVTLKEYVSRMKEDQKEIYYAGGESLEAIKKLPQMEKVLDKGYEVLYFTDSVDEFMTTILREYDGKAFKSIQKGELDLDTEEEKNEIREKEETSKDLLEKIKDVLKDDVSEVRLSKRLVSYPVCLVSDENLSFEMERVLKDLNQNGIRASRILEINPDHPIFLALQKAFEDKKDISDYAKVLYDQALLIAGLPIEDPEDFSRRLSDLLLKAMN